MMEKKTKKKANEKIISLSTARTFPLAMIIFVRIFSRVQTKLLNGRCKRDVVNTYIILHIRTSYVNRSRDVGNNRRVSYIGRSDGCSYYILTYKKS